MLPKYNFPLVSYWAEHVSELQQPLFFSEMPYRNELRNQLLAHCTRISYRVNTVRLETKKFNFAFNSRATKNMFLLIIVIKVQR